MSIKVRYFASLKDQLGRSEDLLNTPSHAINIDEVWNTATHNSPRNLNTLAALNMEYVDFKQPVNDGDEVAFFPPVTGG